MRAAVLLAAAVALFNFAWMPGQFLDGDPAAWREEARRIAGRDSTGSMNSFDNLQRWRARAWAAAAIAVLAYSAYLQVQVNRLGFWIYCEARSALELAYSDAAAEWFRDRHVGVISADLIRHRGDLTALPWFPEFKRKVAEQYVRELSRLIDRGNWYWSLPREART